MTGFRIEIDVEALARESLTQLPWWKRAVICVLGRERVLAAVVAKIRGE